MYIKFYGCAHGKLRRCERWLRFASGIRVGVMNSCWFGPRKRTWISPRGARTGLTNAQAGCAQRPSRKVAFTADGGIVIYPLRAAEARKNLAGPSSLAVSASLVRYCACTSAGVESNSNMFSAEKSEKNAALRDGTPVTNEVGNDLARVIDQSGTASCDA